MAIRMSRLLPLLVLGTAPLLAQSGITTADLKGFCIALEPAGEVPGVTLRLINIATNQTRILVSDAKGEFTFRLLPPGVYTLSVEKAGFKTQIIRDLRLSLGSVANLDLLLETSIAQATVEITADATIVDPTRTQVATVVDNNLINNLPINRRNFVDFSLTTPGVATANSPDNSGAAANSGLTFAGANPRLNNIMVDGMDNNDVSTGSVRSTFSQEAIQEFQVVTNGFSAEYGRAAGGTVNVITKSGGNEFAGSAFFFRRDGSVDAKRPMAYKGQVTPFTRSQFGATASGPIKKDKLFYFASVERLDSTDTNNVTISDTNAAQILQYAGFRVQNGAIPWKETVTTGILKFDWNQSADSRWSARLTWAKEYNENQVQWGGLTDRSAGGARRIEDKTASISNLWNASSTFVNDFRVLSSLRDHDLLSLDDRRSPYVEILGAATFGTQRFLPQARTEKTLQVADTANFFLGKHTLKLGIDLMRTDVKASLPLNFAGIYRFQAYGGFSDGMAALRATNPLNPSINGMPAAFVQGFGNPILEFTVDYQSVFLQDDWQLTPKFTLKLGLRYDREKLPAFQDSASATALNTPDYTSLGANVGPVRLASGSIVAIPGAVGATATGGGPYNFNEMLATVKDWSSSKVSPRASFTYQVSEAFRLYGGYGIFTGRTQLGPYGAVAASISNGIQIYGRTAAGGASPWASWAGTDGGSAGPDGRYASGSAMSPAGAGKIVLTPGTYAMPETKQSNLGFEYSPKSNVRITLDLVYAKGKNFMQVRDVNAVIPNQFFNPLLAVSASNPITRRPDQRFASIFRYDGSGESVYSAQTLGFAWQAGEAFSLTASYTRSRSEDNYLDWLTQFAQQNTFDPKSEMGPSNQNMTHKFTTSAVISTKGLSNAFARNWTIAFIGKITSGRPYTLFTGIDADYGRVGGQAVGNNEGLSAPADRPAGLGRNSETTPTVSNLDVRFSRGFQVGKAKRLETIFEVFNVFNHYNVSKVQNYLTPPPGSPAYGSPIVQSGDVNRQLQLGLKLSF